VANDAVLVGRRLDDRLELRGRVMHRCAERSSVNVRIWSVAESEDRKDDGGEQCPDRGPGPKPLAKKALR
jgi:hypothetical protein